MLIVHQEPSHITISVVSCVASVTDTDRADSRLVRLEPVIFELERVQEDMLVISHASVIRCLVSPASRPRLTPFNAPI